MPQGKGGYKIDLPQLHAISSNIASRHVLQGPLWQISGHVCRSHFSKRPHTRVQMCSASTSSSIGRRCGFNFRRIACRSIAFCSPGQHRSPQACRPQCNPALQGRKHCGGSIVPWWQMVMNVLRPQRHSIGTLRIHAPQAPVWQTRSQACPQGSILPQTSRQLGTGSSHDVRGEYPGMSANKVFPQGQWDTISGDLGQWAGSASCG